MRLLIMGPPGVGKGTQSAILASGLEIPAISTGDMFRAMQASQSELAREVRDVMASGRYVDDALTNRIVVERLSRADCAEGFLLDGYPRTLPQLDFLHRWMAEQDTELDAVLVLEADEETTARRMAARAALDGRPDDTVEAFRVRLRVYAEQTKPLLDVYDELQLLRRVDGTGTVDEVAQRVFAALRPA
ncbi:adenylate kinase [Amnibacterium endophyticum]|uniref:Adenylate kinase n=1 Tax=Amnibacterium endophyticum TaxID=2109337 RepID=A0ABW4LBV9_9MICO